MLRLLPKLFFTSGAISSVFLIDVVSSQNIYFSKKEKKNIETAVQDSENLTSLDSIKLFEKLNGCVFSFVNSWGVKEVYTVDGFIKKRKQTQGDNNKDWTSDIIAGANKDNSKQTCKTKKTATLFYGPHKAFVVENPK